MSKAQRNGMGSRQLPGQLELALEVPELTEDQRAEFAAYVLPGWQTMAACRSVGDDTWFPEPGHPVPAGALGACTDCPVRRSCLAHALAEDEDDGVWGGTTPVQRDVIRQDLATGLPISTALDGPVFRPVLAWQAAC